jgi:hypothetical protein
MKRTFKDKIIDEAFDFYKIDSLLDNKPFNTENEEIEEDSFENDFEDEFDQDGDFEDEFDQDGDFEDEFDQDGDFEDEFDQEPTDPNKEGLIRTVKGAYLVYKRITPDNNYEELWVYNIGNVRSQTRIRNAILSGTDVDPVTLRSPDNEQTATTWSKGNVQYLHVYGLPN